MLRVLVPLGTRPEIVKLAPVVAALQRHGHVVRTVATGQHYSPSMSDAFFDDLGLRPDERWELEGDESERVGSILGSALRELDRHRPDVVLLLGDTWTVPLFCMAARRHGVPLAHLEAGLRSFNPTSVEEVNRKVAAATASLHLAPTELAARFLRYEGVLPEHIRVVGNPVIDVLRMLNVRRVPLDERVGVVVTAHRATNVDDPSRLARLVTLSPSGRRSRPGDVPRAPADAGAAGSCGRVGLARGLGTGDHPARTAGIRGNARSCGFGVCRRHRLGRAARGSIVAWRTRRRPSPFDAAAREGIGERVAALVGLDVDLALQSAVRFTEPDEQAARGCRVGALTAMVTRRSESPRFSPTRGPRSCSSWPSPTSWRAPSRHDRSRSLDLDDTLFDQREWLAGAWEAVADAAAGVDPQVMLAALVDIAAEGSAKGRIIDRALARGRRRCGGRAAGRRVQGPSSARADAVPRRGRSGGACAAAHAGRVGDRRRRGHPALEARRPRSFLGVRRRRLLGHPRAWRKPHPAPFIHAVDALGVRPSGVAFVVIAPRKMSPARSAPGLFRCGCARGSTATCPTSRRRAGRCATSSTRSR